MQRLVLTGAIIAVLLLLHFSFLDLRHRHRGGIGWFWLENPAPPLIWLSRLAMAGAMVAALLTLRLDPSRDLILALFGLLLAHVASLQGWELSQARQDHGPRP